MFVLCVLFDLGWLYYVTGFGCATCCVFYIVVFCVYWLLRVWWLLASFVIVASFRFNSVVILRGFCLNSLVLSVWLLLLFAVYLLFSYVCLVVDCV